MDNTDVPLPNITFLDGDLSTNLIRAGMPEGACTEEWIIQNPCCLEKLQNEFIEAGSSIIYAPSVSVGTKGNSDEVCSQLVALSKKAADSRALTAGVLSFADNASEEDDEIDFFEMFSAYFKQARTLHEAGVDLFVVEGKTSLSQIRAAVLACKRFDVPTFVTVSVNEEGKTATGTSALSALVCVQEMRVSAFGLNCSNPPEEMRDIIADLAPYAKIPLIARPNAGISDENGDFSLSPEEMAVQMLGIVESGASYIGGGLGTTPAHIKAMHEKCRGVKPQSKYNDELNDMIVLCNENQAFFLSPDSIEVSEYIECSQDMSDILLDLNDTNTDIIGVELFTADDAVLFMQNVHMASLPIIFKSQSITALTTALILYPGRACIDSRCDLSEDVLLSLSQKYGAIIY